jgi:WD40 repeat protein
MKVESMIVSLGSVCDQQLKVCHYWRFDKCSKFPCPYLHTELPVSNEMASSNRPNYGCGFRHGSYFKNSWVRHEQLLHKGSGNRGVVSKTEKVCKYWLDGNCNYEENCKFLHSWYKSDFFSLLSQLEGHEKVVMGIVLPFGSDNLYIGSKDGTVRVWDCNSGQCVGVFDLELIFAVCSMKGR